VFKKVSVSLLSKAKELVNAIFSFSLINKLNFFSGSSVLALAGI